MRDVSARTHVSNHLFFGPSVSVLLVYSRFSPLLPLRLFCGAVLLGNIRVLKCLLFGGGWVVLMCVSPCLFSRRLP